MSKADILAEITAICEPLLPVQPDEVVIADVADQWDCSVSTAQRRLSMAVDAGQLTKRRALNTAGRECWAYRVVT